VCGSSDNLSTRTPESRHRSSDVRESLHGLSATAGRLRAWEETARQPFALCRSTSPGTTRACWECAAPGAARSGGCIRRAARRALLDESAPPSAYTVDNNGTGTHNLLCGHRRRAAGMLHIVHLAARWGCNGLRDTPRRRHDSPRCIPHREVPQGGTRGRPSFREKILHPHDPRCRSLSCSTHIDVSIQQNDNIRVTDLHQGMSLGHNTDSH